jgi:Pentapeptide repeats (8 copies)
LRRRSPRSGWRRRVTPPAADARGNGAERLSSSGRSADFRRANLDSADLDPARALCANFTDVDLTRTKLGSATLGSAYPTGAMWPEGARVPAGWGIDSTGTPMLMARSGHTSVRSLAKYARVSAEALARHQAERDGG